MSRITFKTASDIESFANASAEAIRSLREEVGTMRGDAWGAKFSKHEPDYAGIGRFIKAVRYGSRSAIEEAGGKPGSIDEKADLGTPLYSDAATGSYIVPTQYATEVARFAQESSVLMSKMTAIPMTTRTCVIPSESTAPAFSWSNAQSSSLSETNPTFGSTTLTSYVAAAWIGLNASLIEDNDVAVGAYFATRFGEEWGLEVDKQVLTGTGTPCYGLLNASGTATDHTLGEGKASQDDLEADDFIDAISDMAYARYRRGSEWFMSPSCFDVVRKLKDAQGRYLVSDFISGGIPSICGYRVNVTDAINTPGTSTRFIVFGNPKHVYFGKRIDLEVKLFDNTSYRVTDDEVLLRARARVGFAFPLGASAFIAIKTAAS